MFKSIRYCLVAVLIISKTLSAYAFSGSVMNTATAFAGCSASVWDATNGSSSSLYLLDPTESTFSGTGNWSEPGRWSNGIPGPTTAVTISGTCTVDANYSVSSLTITSGYALHIDPGHILTVSGAVTNNAGTTGLVLESDSTGTGMLMNNSTGVQATVEQYLTRYQWHLMGIPVTYLPDVNTVLHGCYVAWMDESNAYYGLSTGWQYLVPGDSMLAMGGYAVRYGWDASLYPKTSDTTVTFSGTLNTGVQDTIFASETEGWNLISNPYPVTMDWDATGGKNLFRTNDAFHVWNQSLNSGAGNYGSYGAYVSGGSTNGQTRYIPPMQGFFVEVWHINAGITFYDNAKVAVASTLFCDAGNPPGSNINSPQFIMADKGTGKPSIKLAVTSNGRNFDETLIRADERSTDQFDSHYDAAKLKAIGSKLSQLYSVVNGREYSINTLPAITEKTVIPLRVMVRETGKQHLSIKERMNLPGEFPLILYDKNGTALANLAEGGFDFEGTLGETESFYLGFRQIDPKEIIAMDKGVQEALARYAQVVITPTGQGAFAVQRHSAGNTENSGSSSIN